jgi:hypothetical protein
VRAINTAWPGNTTLEQWLASYDNGTANVPTQHNIDRNIELYRRGSEFWDFNEAPLSDEYVNTGWNPARWPRRSTTSTSRSASIPARSTARTRRPPPPPP